MPDKPQKSINAWVPRLHVACKLPGKVSLVYCQVNYTVLVPTQYASIPDGSSKHFCSSQGFVIVWQRGAAGHQLLWADAIPRFSSIHTVRTPSALLFTVHFAPCSPPSLSITEPDTGPYDGHYSTLLLFRARCSGLVPIANGICRAHRGIYSLFFSLLVTQVGHSSFLILVRNTIAKGYSYLGSAGSDARKSVIPGGAALSPPPPPNHSSPLDGKE